MEIWHLTLASDGRLSLFDGEASRRAPCVGPEALRAIGVRLSLERRVLGA